MKYTIGSSFYDKGRGGDTFRRDFAQIWYHNTMNAMPAPERVIVVSEGGSRPFCAVGVDTLNLTGDLGHCHDLIERRKPHEFSSWSASMCLTALAAYDNETDFIYKEEDCLAFGDWVRRLYHDMGSADMAFGAKMKSPPWMPCAQSLFIVRHSFIPKFVSMYLGMGGERDRNNLGEAKFCRIESLLGASRVRRHTLACDRERPIPWDSGTFYFQQPTPAELEEARRRNLI